MNIINVKIDFEHGICRNKGISVVTGDYNSTKVVFDFSDEIEGTKIFEMKNPEGELVYADEIVNNEVVLVGYKEENGETETYSLFTEEGDYIFEVSLYGNDSKLTSVSGYINATKEQVIVEGEEVQEKITLFDNLIQELNAAISETDNLDIEVSKEDKKTTISITNKEGETHTEEILDGEDGASLENIEIVDRNLEVTYGGETENLGQIVPNIQVGTTTTGLPNTSASVVNVGTDLNPILNFTIPKGEAGAIKMLIVDELPTTGQEDTIYLVPLENPDVQGNNYAEYVYINGEWELLGKIGVQVDLTDYYTKTETNTLLNGKVGFTDYASSTAAGVIKISYESGINRGSTGYITTRALTYAQYGDAGNGLFVGKGTLENVITGKGLTTKSYVDGLVGDINTALDTINGEVI